MMIMRMRPLVMWGIQRRRKGLGSRESSCDMQKVLPASKKVSTYTHRATNYHETIAEISHLFYSLFHLCSF